MRGAKFTPPKRKRSRGERGSPKMNLQGEPLHLKEATVTCIPRLRGGGGVGRRSRTRGGSAAASTQVSSVLDRLRDVVLRLAMLSAAATSSSTKQQGTLRRRSSATATTTSTPARAEARVSPAYADSYRSEAVDDCIEFLKRSAAGTSGGAAVEASTAAASPLHVPCHVNRN